MLMGRLLIVTLYVIRVGVAEIRLMNGLRDSSSRCRRSNRRDSRSICIAVDLSLGAVARYVSGLATAVASLAGGVEGSAIGSSAVTRDVA
jgi:hypothetical protein